MKNTFILYALVLFTASCSKIAHRVAYGPATVISIPRTPSEAVGEAVQVKRTIEQYQKDKKQQQSKEKEDRYAAMQQQEQNQPQPSASQPAETVTSDRDIELENSRFDNEVLRKQLEACQRKPAEDLSRLKGLVDIETQLADGYRKQAQKERTRADSIKHAYEDLEDKYARLKAGTEQLMNSPWYERKQSSQSHNSAHRSTSSQYYIRGPRGGCYYLTGSGRKQYVDRSLCN